MEQRLQSMKREANLAVWAEQVRACRSSGLKVNEWCAANGIKPNAYYRHQKKVFHAMQAEDGQFYEVPTSKRSGTGSLPAFRSTDFLQISTVEQTKIPCWHC